MAARREQVVKTAEKFVARGKIEAAIREYRKVLGENPNDSTTLNRVGDLYARIERIDEAVELFSQIAENYTKDGFFVKAIAIYKKIIKLDPTRLDAIEHLAELYDRQGLVNEARTQYQVLADYYLNHGNRGSALSAYERMAALEPDNPSHHVKLAELYQAQKMTAKAIGEYRIIAELMISHERPEEAAKVYERALDVDASDVGFITDAVLRLREAGQTGAAAHLLAAAVRLNPEAQSVASLVAAEERGKAAQASVPVEEVTLGDGAAAAASSPYSGESSVQEAAPAVVVPVAERDEEIVPVVEDDTLYDLDLTVGEGDVAEPPSAYEEASAAPIAEEVAAEAAEALEGEEIELDLDDVFVLDLDQEEAPASLVQPPADLLPPESPAEAAPTAVEPAAAADVERTLPEIEPLPDLEENFFELDVDEAVGDDVPGVEVAARSDLSPAEDFSLPEEGPAAADDAIDEDFLERTAAELQPVAVRPEEDLFTEAEVLAKYGLEEKAMERLEEVLDLDPHHLGAMALLVRFDLEKGRHHQVLARANELASLAADEADGPWPELRQQLLDAGYKLEGNQVLAPPARTLAEADVGHLLDGLMDEAPPVAEAPAAPPPPRRKVRDASIEEALASLETTFQSGKKALRQGVEPAAGEEAPAADVFEAAPSAEPAVPEAQAPEAQAEEPQPQDVPAPAAEDDPEDSGVRWLDEVGEAPPAEAGETPAVVDDVFEDEDDFFDLAAEIEQELDAEDSLTEAIETPAEPSLEEIVEGFKQGVAENLSPEDFDTHFNLGIAYREMGLLDEAIGEFQLASKDPGRLVECCSMLGLCFLEKGLPDLAVKWYRRGLESPTLAEEDRHGLLYDLGNLYLDAGDFEQAHEVFVDIYGVNSNYRDVVAKLEEIAARAR
ncbi:MAG: tetratricopeptide repeat protein [Acidobacteriota bacterium]